MSRFLKLLCALLCALLFSLTASAQAPSLISESAVLIDADTGQVLYDKQMHKQQYPASITKIATVIVGLEHASLSDKIVMSEEAVFSVARDTSHIALTTDEEITFENAAYAALLMSANDACNGIAEHVSGDIDSFVALMNESVREYGAKNTHFSNANGLKDSEHYTTAYDMAMICAHAIKNTEFRKIFSSITYQMPPNNKQPERRYFANQHSMMADPEFKYDGIIGGKAGWTTAAQFTLVTAAERDGRTLIAVVMKSPRNDDKYTDTKALLDYGFSEFDAVTVNSDAFPLKEPATVLLPVGTEAAGISFSSVIENGREYISLTLDTPPATMPSYLGKFPAKTAVKTVKQISEDDGVSDTDRGGISFLGVIGIILGTFVLLIILLLLAIIIRKKIYRMLRRRRRRRRQGHR